ncbi:hypothetical protein FNH13_14810 [Ornithinimicrobium ciconiae]|uniref:Uncharacterized protein n=1 Tax=Ornithinimicrobium ciconiae TaxID=2594265 RepID=A0A516GD47_9MICO|nr:hypothetical protein [Ornithinimicrobium ciconiae]QDO89444.1 hypothetical protein FNH13_14810 [Ornithinimicrobium ciconiae]
MEERNVTPVIITSAVWLFVALGTLALRVRVASGRFAHKADTDVGEQAQRWMASPFIRWGDVFLSASSCIATWFVRGQGAVAVLLLLAGVAFAASAWLGWRTRARLGDEDAAEPHEAGDGPARRRSSAVPLGVSGMLLALASQAIRGAAGDDPNTATIVALMVTMIGGVTLLIAAAFAAFKAATEKAQRDYLENR